MKKTKNKPIWYALFIDTFRFCVCVTEKDMQRVGKDLGCEVSTDRNYGGAVHDKYDSSNVRINILHMPNWKNGDSYQLGLLVHEATHVVQNLMAHINEKHPSDEFQAFMIQGVFNIAHAHLKSRQTKRSKK